MKYGQINLFLYNLIDAVIYIINISEQNHHSRVKIVGKHPRKTNRKLTIFQLTRMSSIYWNPVSNHHVGLRSKSLQK